MHVYLHLTEPKFYVKNSCCLLLAGNCLESYSTYCMCVCVHSSVCLYMILCLLRMNLCWLAILRLGETKERDPNRHSGLRLMMFLCVQLTSEPGRTSFRTGFTVKQTLLGETACTPEPSFVCNVYQSLTVCVYVYVSSRPSWPRCPQSPQTHPPLPFHSLQRATLESVSALFSWGWLYYYKTSAGKLWLFEVRCSHPLLISSIKAPQKYTFILLLLTKKGALTC